MCTQGRGQTSCPHNAGHLNPTVTLDLQRWSDPHHLHTYALFHTLHSPSVLYAVAQCHQAIDQVKYNDYQKGTARALPERVLVCVRTVSRHFNTVSWIPFKTRKHGFLICTVIGAECICCLPLGSL